MNAFEKIRSILAEQLSIDADTITMETDHFMDVLTAVQFVC